MNKLIALLMGTALAVGGGAVVQLAARGDDASATSTTSLGTAETTTPNAPDSRQDVSGRCDEAEHANDPRCTTPAASPARTVPREAGEDISGPCDEAEHATDPRCTGRPAVDDDRSGRRGGDDRDDHSGRGRGGDDDPHHD